jgi:hypothetical protein
MEQRAITALSDPVYRGREYCNTTIGNSLFAAARNALDFFQAPIWKGPRPTEDCILEVLVLGDQKRYRVRAGQVIGLR